MKLKRLQHAMYLSPEKKPGLIRPSPLNERGPSNLPHLT